MKTIINKKEVDWATIEIDGIDTQDYPDFCDAYVCSAQFVDGTELDDTELEELDEYVRDSSDFIEMIMDTLY